MSKNSLRNKLHEIKNNEEGFSLPEMMIIVLIIGVLAAIAIPIYINSQNATKEGDLTTALLAASTSVETEKSLNNGLYPDYIPKSATPPNAQITFAYTYSDSRFDYCIKGTGYGLTQYVGSKTKGKVSSTACVLNNVGATQPDDAAPDGTVNVNNHQPVISSITPTTIYTRKADVETIIINGSDFMNGAVVLFDGATINSVNVINSNKISFVSTGATAYKSVSVQVKNPNGRTSLPATLNLVNPITVAPGNAAPIGVPTLTTSAIVATMNDTQSLTLNAVPVSCAVKDVTASAPQYSFRMIRDGEATKTTDNGISWTKADGKEISDWQAGNSVVVPNLKTGDNYGFQVRARCVLEGKESISSAWTDEKLVTLTIAQPNAPRTAPTTTATAPYLINKSIDFSMSEYTWGTSNLGCPTMATPYYTFYDASTNVYSDVNTSFYGTTGTTARTANLTYTVYCKSPYTQSVESNKSPALTLNIINKPDAPTATGLVRLQSNNGTSLSFLWGAVSCNLGTPQYLLTVTSAGQPTTTSNWTTATLGNIATLQGYDYVASVSTRCNLNGIVSDSVAPKTLNVQALVLNPTGDWTYNLMSGSNPVTIHSFGPSCTTGANAVYRKLIWTTDSSKDPTYTPWSTSSHSTTSLAAPYNISVSYMKCQSTRTDKVVQSVNQLQAPVLPANGFNRT